MTKDSTISTEYVLRRLRQLARKEAGIDYTVNDESMFNQVTLAQGILLVLERKV